MTTDATLLSTGTQSQDTGGTQTKDATQTDGAKVAEGKTADTTTDKTVGDTTTTTQDRKTAEGDKAADGTSEGDQTDKPVGAPEKYEFKNPEGVTLNDEVIGSFSEIARELNLPQDAAQKMIDKMGTKIMERQLTAVKAQSTAWASTSKADPVLGKPENLAIAKTAIDNFASPELKKMLGDYDPANNPTGLGLGNHPEVIRLFLKAGQKISEDQKIVQGSAPTTESTAAKTLYPAKQS